MADGTLKVGTITTSSGSGDITIPSGNGMTGHMYPAFQAYLSDDQTITDNTVVKINIDTEDFDTDNCYDNTTNYRFTPNKAGKYFLNANIQLVSSSNGNYYYVYIQKGSTLLARNLIRPGNSGSIYLDVNTVADLSDGDSVKVVVHFQNTESVNRGTDGSKTYFLGYRLIGA